MMGQILPAFLLQQIIQLVHAVHSGDRNTGIAADVSHKTFHKSLFVTGCGIAEYGFKSVVCRQCGISRLFLCVCPKSILDRHLGVVKDDMARDSPEIFQCMYVCFQKTFFVLSAVC